MQCSAPICWWKYSTDNLFLTHRKQYRFLPKIKSKGAHFCKPRIKCSFRIQIADVDYKKAFEDELVAFKDRIRRRAEEKIREQIEEAKLEEEEERVARLGPGGLDPVEVFENLPQVSTIGI